MLVFEAHSLCGTQRLKQPFKMKSTVTMPSIKRKKTEKQNSYYSDITGSFLQEDR